MTTSNRTTETITFRINSRMQPEDITDRIQFAKDWAQGHGRSPVVRIYNVAEMPQDRWRSLGIPLKTMAIRNNLTPIKPYSRTKMDDKEGIYLFKKKKYGSDEMEEVDGRLTGLNLVTTIQGGESAAKKIVDVVDSVEAAVRKCLRTNRSFFPSYIDVDEVRSPKINKMGGILVQLVKSPAPSWMQTQVFDYDEYKEKAKVGEEPEKMPWDEAEKCLRVMNAKAGLMVNAQVDIVGYTPNDSDEGSSDMVYYFAIVFKAVKIVVSRASLFSGPGNALKNENIPEYLKHHWKMTPSQLATMKIRTASVIGRAPFKKTVEKLRSEWKLNTEQLIKFLTDGVLKIIDKDYFWNILASLKNDWKMNTEQLIDFMSDDVASIMDRESFQVGLERLRTHHQMDGKQLLSFIRNIETLSVQMCKKSNSEKNSEKNSDVGPFLVVKVRFIQELERFIEGMLHKILSIATLLCRSRSNNITQSTIEMVMRIKFGTQMAENIISGMRFGVEMQMAKHIAILENHSLNIDTQDLANTAKHLFPRHHLGDTVVFALKIGLEHLILEMIRLSLLELSQDDHRPVLEPVHLQIALAKKFEMKWIARYTNELSLKQGLYGHLLQIIINE